MNIVSEKHNPHLKRKEIVVDIEHGAESTPSKAVVHELIAKQLSADKEKIEIIDILSEKGLAKSKSKILIWEEVPKKKEKIEEQKETAIEVKEESKVEKKETNEEKPEKE